MAILQLCIIIVILIAVIIIIIILGDGFACKEDMCIFCIKFSPITSAAIQWANSPEKRDKESCMYTHTHT